MRWLLIGFCTFLIGLCSMLSGCTAEMWQKSDVQVVSVNGFYVNQQTDDLLVTSPSDVYLFPTQAQLGEALMLSRELRFLPTFKNIFNVA